MSGYKTGALRWLWWTEEPQRVVRFWPPLHGMETTRSTSLPRKSCKFTENGEIHHVPSFLSGILIPDAKRCISAVACWSLHSCLDIMQLSVLSSWVWLENPRFVSIWKFPKSWQYPQIIHFGYVPSEKPSSYWSAIGVPLSKLGNLQISIDRFPVFGGFQIISISIHFYPGDFGKPPNFDDFSSFFHLPRHRFLGHFCVPWSPTSDADAHGGHGDEAQRTKWPFGHAAGGVHSHPGWMAWEWATGCWWILGFKKNGWNWWGIPKFPKSPWLSIYNIWSKNWMSWGYPKKKKKPPYGLRMFTAFISQENMVSW